MSTEEMKSLSKTQKMLLIGITLFGVIVFPILCVLYLNNVISAFGAMNAMTFSNPSPEQFHMVTESVTNTMPACITILFSAMCAIMGYALSSVFFEDKKSEDKKYLMCLNIVSIIGGVICIIGMNLPATSHDFITVNSVLFGFGGVLLICGCLRKLGVSMFNPPNVLEK